MMGSEVTLLLLALEAALEVAIVAVGGGGGGTWPLPFGGFVSGNSMAMRP